ncbi:MAG TPA: hypothetical protein VK427_26395, partial [Kofleriaceae bacterium]|nr:hypothetical protein [Kofleriaceae bacterium]
ATPDASAALVTADQLVTAIVPDWSSTTAELRLWRRDGGAWKLAMGPWPGVVGSRGTAWGAGLHGTGAPVGRDGPVKREGDAKAPAGAFLLRKSYGYAARAETALGYQPVDGAWRCVDDPRSQRYTQIFDARGVEKDWSSAEDMRRKDALYTWVVDVAHNPTATPGAGSCIFLHVWRDATSPTVGCTAMAEAELARLIAALAPGAMYVLLPATEYDALATTWGLP